MTLTSIIMWIMFQQSSLAQDCGNVPQDCNPHISWATNNGRWQDASWYETFQEITDVALNDATLEDMTLYFFCKDGLDHKESCEGLQAPCGRVCGGSTCETKANAGTLGFALSTGFMSNTMVPSTVANIVRDSEVKKIRLYGWANDVQIIAAVLNIVPDATFVIEIPPYDVEICAYSANHCTTILQQYVPYKNSITHVAIGNEPLHAGAASMTFSRIQGVVSNVAHDLSAIGFTAKVTVPFSMKALQNTWPIKNSEFHEPPSLTSKGCGESGCVTSVAGGLMDKLLTTLLQVNGVLAIHPYPYFVANGDANLLQFSLDASIIFNNQVLSFQEALRKLGKSALGLIITEVGWPTSGTPEATSENAQSFLSSLANNANRGDLAFNGIDIYAFEFFDESKKGGSTDEQHFGWYTENGCKKFDILEISSTLNTTPEPAKYVLVDDGNCPTGFAPVSDVYECMRLPGSTISGRQTTTFHGVYCYPWWTPADTCFVYTENNRVSFTMPGCSVTKPAYSNHQLVCKRTDCIVMQQDHMWSPLEYRNSNGPVGRSVETSVSMCAERCENTEGCFGSSWWAVDRGCYLAGHGAHLIRRVGALSHSCQSESNNGRRLMELAKK